MKKEWRDVPNYEGRYQVSNIGELKSFAYGSERILKGSISNDGYRQYTLNYKEKGLYNVFGAHQLVAMCFLNHEPNGVSTFVVDHIDDNKLNNNLSNLRLISNHENCVKRYEEKHLFGVSKVKNGYTSKVWHNGKMVYLGYYKDENNAHIRALKYLKDNNIERNIGKEGFKND